MKLKLSLLTLSMLPLIAFAQMDFPQVAKEKIAVLDLMVGTWEGKGYLSTPTGKDSSNVAETIQYKLDKTVLFIEGQGTRTLPDGTNQVVHDALGVISINPFTNEYQMNSFISKGMSTQAKLEIMDDTHMIWWFKAGPTTIRYALSIIDNQWIEIGERSMDGENWIQFFEMKLDKVK